MARAERPPTDLDVLVIGTGAGGAPLLARLAAGRAFEALLSRVPTPPARPAPPSAARVTLWAVRQP